jgi:hypothetical protein
MIHPGFLVLLAGAALLPQGRTRSLGVLAVVALGLGVAGLRAGPSAGDFTPPPGFAAVEAALFTMALGLAGAAAVFTLRRARSPVMLMGSAAVVGGAAGVALTNASLWAAAPAGTLAAALAVIGGAGLLLVAVGRLSGRRVSPACPSLPRSAIAVMGVGALLALIGPWTGLVFLGAIVAAVEGWMAQRRADPRALPIAPLLTLLLMPAWWFMAAIAGPEGLAVASLPDLPWSPAAERLLAPVLILPAWAMSGLWPLHREEPAPFTAPVGALLLVRVALPAVPDGVEQWRAAAIPVVLIGLWHAVLSRRWAAALTALALMGLLSVRPGGQLGAGLVLAAGLLSELGRRTRLERPPLEAMMRWGAGVLAGIGVLLIVEAGLRAEVVYTVVAAAALVAAAGLESVIQASTASEPSAMTPSS